MRTSPALLVIATALAILFGLFQNCSETLPDKQMLDAASVATPPAPTPNPQPPPPNPTPSPTSVSFNSAGIAPNSILPGHAVALNLQATANSNVNNATLKLTVRNAATTTVWTQSYSGQAMIANQLKNFSESFATPEALPPGNYTLSAEVLTSTGQTLYSGTNIANLTVNPPVRVAVGRASAYTDTLGRVWSADFGISGTSSTWYEVLPSYQGTNDPELYSSFRFGTAPQSFTFTTPVPGTGKYKVTLKWIEHFVFAPNQRLFSVQINGNTVVQDLDLFVAAGGTYKAYDRTFSVIASTPQIQVTFLAGAADNPKINAIEIVGSP